jgi:hypothetical protein
VNRRSLLEAFAAFATPAGRHIECAKPLGLAMFSKKALAVSEGQIIVTDQSVFLPNGGGSFLILNVAVGPVFVHTNRTDSHQLKSLEAADFLHTDGEWRRIKAL